MTQSNPRIDTGHDTTSNSKTLALPARVSVSLRAGAVLAIANVLCAAILAFAWVHAKAEPKVITVTGSAKKAIQSDLIVWSVGVTASDADLAKAYDRLKSSTDRTLAYMRDQGIADKDVTVSSISMAKHFVKDERGADTEKVRNYELHQMASVHSTDIMRVSTVEKKITELLKEGILLESGSAKYLYTKLADLKISMLADATKDATTRAAQIATNSGAKLGKIRDARMGVMQINPVHSDEVSGSGVNDTTSYDKEITAVVSAKFELE